MCIGGSGVGNCAKKGYFGHLCVHGPKCVKRQGVRLPMGMGSDSEGNTLKETQNHEPVLGSLCNG